jgi:uncharacterized protein
VEGVEVPVWGLLALSFVTAGAGTLGGLGGAVLLVPSLVLLGVPAHQAAPLGLLSVAAGSLAAGPVQLAAGLVHHRLAVVTETAASAGAVTGAIVAAAVPAPALARVLGVTALGAAAIAVWRRGALEPPSGALAAEEPGEWPGTLWGAYRTDGGVVPYHAVRLGRGLGVVGLAGVIAGAVGVGGGFIKTPALSEIMGVPVKVAAATTTFTVGVTAAAGLTVFAVQGRLDTAAGAAVVLASIAGGFSGTRVQDRMDPSALRLVVAGLVAAAGVALLVGG